jgi:protease-4
MPGTLNDAEHITKDLKKALQNPHTLGVILRINSPGGSAVQSSRIYNALRRLQHQHPHKKVYAVCGDACASGAYYIASAANEIYANPVSIVGSIGVTMSSFDASKALQKLGIKKRKLFAGKHKDFLDPFLSMSEQDKAYAQKLLATVHKQFIHDVKQGRGKRLNTSDANLFSGRIWTGKQALKLGLIDHYGDTTDITEKVLKTSNVVNYSEENNFLNRLTKQMGSNMGTSFAHSFQAFFSKQIQ